MVNNEEIKLSNTQRKQLSDLDEQIIWIKRQITKAKVAGIDMSKQEEQLERSEKLRASLLNLY